MAKIPLRTYVKNIENFIEKGEIDQAIVHAKHILQSYPKHTDTYRMLGKAYLENQRYAEAADILQRVLSVYPDDFISHIGMSIIREDEGNLDGAIWHMERAYEVQPFNPAVQDELRRLYGRRDGIEPPKIRLTRGALVRMYARGDLYAQAIAEIRAALAEDPQRFDLQALMARLYLKNGQKIEATETCSALISKLPYCFEANRILVEILPGTSRAEDVKIFQQRLVALDPYEAFVSPSAPTASLVPDQAVAVEEFTFGGQGKEVEAPEWAQNAGVEWKEEPKEELPGWLNTLAPEKPAEAPAETPPAAQEEPPAQPAEAASGELIPDWMKSAGWKPSTGTAEEAPTSFEESAGEEDAALAEIPEWLQNVAPPAGEETQQGDQERLDWLESILPGEKEPGQGEPPAESPPQAPEPSISTSEEAAIPSNGSQDADWLAMLGTQPEQPAGEQPAGEEDWMQSLKTEGEAQPPTGEAEAETAPSELPDWMSALTPQEEEAAPSEETPEWLKAFSQEEATQPGPEAPETEAPQAEMPAETQPESQPGAPLPEPSAESSQMPDWLKSLEPETPPVEAAPTEIQSVETPQALEAEPPQAVETPQVAEAQETPGMPDMNDMDATMAWLESLAAKQGAEEGTLSTRPEERTETPPEWVQAEIAGQVAEPQHAGENPFDQVEEPAAQPPATEVVAAGAAEPQPAAEESAATGEIPEELSPQTPAQEAPAEEPVAEKTQPVRVRSEEETPQAAEQPQVTEQPQAIEQSQAQAPDQTIEQPTVLQTPPAQEAPLAQEAPAGEAPDFEDMDQAMAWLESLAAKQGADEATLTTPPEQRTETPPEWLTKAAEGQPAEGAPEAEMPANVEAGLGEAQPATEEAAPAELPDWLKEVGAGESEQASAGGAEEAQPAESGMSWLNEVEQAESPQGEAQAEAPASEAPGGEAPEFENMDQAMAWLEGLAAKQGADEATLTTSPEQRTETPPEWLQAEVSDLVAEPSKAGESPFAQEPPAEELPQSAVAEPAAEEPEATAQETTAAEAQADSDNAFSWLESLAAKQGAEEGTLLTRPEDRQEIPPEWVQQVAAEEEATPEAPVEALPDEKAAEETPAAPGVEEEGFGWLAESEPAPVESTETSQWIPEEIEPEAEAQTEQAPADEIKPETAPEAEAPQVEVKADETMEEWLRGLESEVELTPTDQITGTVSAAEPPQWLPAESSTPAPAETGEIDTLEAAQAALTRGNLEPALDCYSQFIQRGEKLDEVVHDLRDALYRYPVDISIWQCLGDAYARNNQLQEALDAYTKAEELLR